MHWHILKLALFYQHVDISHWAGLGGVRFIPSEYVKGVEDICKDLTETEENLINQRNMELVRTHFAIECS